MLRKGAIRDEWLFFVQVAPNRRRFIFGYALDNSEFPCYLVWPQRDGNACVLLDTATYDTLPLSETSFFRLLGMHHFCDSFALVSQIGIQEDALMLFDLREEELLSDLHISAWIKPIQRYLDIWLWDPASK